MCDRHIMSYDKNKQLWVIRTFANIEHFSLCYETDLFEAEVFSKRDFGVTLNQNYEYEVLNDSNFDPVKMLELANGRDEAPTVSFEYIK